MSFNKITIVGNLGRDPELRYTPQGTPVCSFSMATSEKRKDEETTTWFRVTLWGRQAEVASQYLAKGKQAYVEGRISAQEWQDKDGKMRFSIEVNATDLKLIDGRQESPARGSDSEIVHSAPPDDDDEIPF